MRIGFVSRQYAQGYQGGDRILDEMARKVLSTEVELINLELPRDGNSRALMRTLLRRSHPALETYSQPANADRIASFAKRVDVLVISHEALVAPFLASGTLTRACVILHNVLGHARGELGVRRFFRHGAARVERQVLVRPATNILLLSRREESALRAEGWVNVVACPPGIRGVFATRPERIDTERLVINGTTDWGLKRRDLKRFVAEYKAANLPFPLGTEEDIRDDAHLRIAVITDRFSAGFKLKAADLLCRNTALVSYVDLAADFPQNCAPRASLRVIRRPEEITDAIEALKRDIVDVADEMAALKSKMNRSMTWEAFGKALLSALEAGRTGRE